MTLFIEEILLAAPTVIIVGKMVHIFAKDRMEQGTPAFLTTLGIFGTFLGLVFGLYPFMLGGNADISASLPGLIKGVAIACICSAAGVGLSLASKHAQNKVNRKKGKELEQTGATADTLAALLGEILKCQQAQTLSATTLQKSIAGDEDGSLLTQLQKTRTEFADKHDSLIGEFKRFADTMTKNNTDALVQALSTVIKDFNQKISEQFGENFKHLNEAIGKLLEWQISYKDEIQTLTNQFRVCANGIESSKNALEIISEKSDSIVNSASTLEALLITYEDQKSKLSDNLTAFSSLSTEANNAFPLIHENINKITNGFSDATENLTQSHKAMITNQGDFLDRVINSYETMDQRMLQCSEKMLQDSQAHIKEMASRLYTTLTEMSEKINSQINNLDMALEEELTKSLKSLGDQLSSLSSKFVSDYGPLTEKLTKIVQISRKVGIE